MSMPVVRHGATRNRKIRCHGRDRCNNEAVTNSVSLFRIPKNGSGILLNQYAEDNIICLTRLVQAKQ